MAAEPEPQHPRRWRFASLPTGAKLFLILTAALMPLALIALLAAMQSNRIADAETRARLRVAASESARALGIELVGDMTAIRVALNALDQDPEDAPSCARVQGVFADQLASGARFAIVGGNGQPLCSSMRRPDLRIVYPPSDGPISAAIDPARGLALGLTAPSGRLHAVAQFGGDALAQIARPSGFLPAYSSVLTRGNDRLPLEGLAGLGPLDRTESLSVPVGVDNLSFEMTVRSAPITSPLIVAMLLPVLMWVAAAVIGWFVVDALLIRPLRTLRREVAAYRPGEVITPPADAAAQEIRELGDTFRAISQTVVAHEAGLAEGLVRQTKLTREVHHRVKNNLQVISSLINLHARGAHSGEARGAYASIQRRVDALSVVHRNHFAELEETRGLQLRTMVSDLASNIRATAPEDTHLTITLDIDGYLANQDMAIAMAFLLTEMIELAMMVQADAALRVSLRPAPDGTEGRALLRVSSPALVDGDRLRDLLAERYGRVIEGLARQLRSKLHYEPLSGAYEILVSVTGRG